MSNNGSMIYKRKCLSFINKIPMMLLYILLLLILTPLSCIFFTIWDEIPLIMKIIWPILLAIVLIGIIFTFLNGMLITRRGTVLFVPDLRVKIINMEDVERVAFDFNEWENDKYSVMVKFVYKDGKVWQKDYSIQFRNMIRNRKITMSLYTIKKRKVDKIRKKLLDFDKYVITIIDKNGNVTHQEKNKKM